MPEIEAVLTTIALWCSAGGGPEHLDALSVEEDDRAQVDVQLHVQALGLDLGHGGPDPDARVVDQHVEPPEALAVRVHDLLDRVLGGHVPGHVCHLMAVAVSSATAASSFSGRRAARVTP